MPPNVPINDNRNRSQPILIGLEIDGRQETAKPYAAPVIAGVTATADVEEPAHE